MTARGWLAPTRAALVATALLSAACRQPASPPRTDETDANAIIPVGAEPAQVGSMRAVIHASGLVVPADGAEFLVVAPEPARIVDVSKNQGDAVAAGELLVRFELPTAAQELARQQAEVARLQAQLENVRVNRQRIADLVERGLVARNDLNQTERESAEAEAGLAAATSGLKRVQDTIARASVRAPFAGIVANRLHNPGDLVQAVSTDPVLRIVDPSRLEVLATIPGPDVSRVLPGSTARIAGSVNGQPVVLSVAGRPAGAADAEGRLRVRLTFASPATLPVDAPIEIDIDAEERVNVVFVSPSALVGTGADAALFVAVNDIAERRTVTTGVVTDLGVEITSGLQAGELVITRGQAGVTHGARISAAITR